MSHDPPEHKGSNCSQYYWVCLSPDQPANKNLELVLKSCRQLWSMIEIKEKSDFASHGADRYFLKTNMDISKTSLK